LKVLFRKCRSICQTKRPESEGESSQQPKWTIIVKYCYVLLSLNAILLILLLTALLEQVHCNHLMLRSDVFWTISFLIKHWKENFQVFFHLRWLRYQTVISL
jgi:hypothetical protein